jgi:hypothetical protein
VPRYNPDIIKQAENNFPTIVFKKGDEFRWSPHKKTIFYRQLTSLEEKAMFLHELGHAARGHVSFNSDIELIKRENEAWQYAKNISAQFNVSIDEGLVQDHLDTYRDWLASRSQCPQCEQTGLQTGECAYECINCASKWKVNDARNRRLRRYVKAAGR